MNPPLSLEQQLLQGVSFEVAPEPRVPSGCPHAQAFAAWCEELVQPVREQPTEITVNIAINHITVQFFAHYHSTRKHQHEVKQSKRPCNCLFDVFESFFVELRGLLWKVNPPLLRPPPAPPPQQQIAGVPWMSRK